MKNINDPMAYEEIVYRVTLLSNFSKKKWGKMTLQQMLKHCTTQLRLALGEIPATQQGSFMMRTTLGRWIALGNIPWPKGSSTPNEMNVEKNSFAYTDIDVGKVELRHCLTKVRDAESLKQHPFFGSLSKNEWGQLVYKHLDHHLKQFSQ